MKKSNRTKLVELLIFSLLLIMPFLFFFVEPATTASLLDVSEAEISLNQPDGGTSAAKAMFLTGANEGEALDIALRYLKENQEALGLSDADLANLMVTDQYVSQHNGVTHIYLRQRFNEIEVPDGNININLAPDGSVMNLGNSFVSCDTLIRCVAPAPVLRAASLSATQAVHSAAQQLGLSGNRSLMVLRRSRSAAQEVLLSDGGISLDSIPVKLVYQPVEEGEPLRLAWDMVIRLENGQNWWNLRVDALTGELLTQEDWMVNENWVANEEAEREIEQEQRSTYLPPPSVSTHQPTTAPTDGAQYRVFPFPYVSPEEPGASHTLVTNPADPIASPFGWHDTDGVVGAEFTDTRGNNVFAQEDADGNDKGGFRLDGGANLLFDYPFDATFSPSGSLNEEASTVNLFYWNNLSHDIFYHYGFDEASGNFQHNNYGHDGIAGDALQADTQDRTSLNNANFGTPPDGQKPRMQMFVWTLTAPYRDSALENSVIVHEYAHGISNRLTGGPSNANCLLNTEQMGEGWSDWLALAVTTIESDQATDARGTGAYLLGQPPTGRGIRFYPYSTDMKINRHTYQSIENAISEHQVGEVWAQMLWEMYWILVDEHGFNPNVYGDWSTGGNNLAIQLVMDGMKLQPCRPGFVDGRDAILAADAVLTDGANQCLIWDAFAKRGLGFSAEQGHSDSIIDGIEAFDLPPSCQFMTVTPTTNDICVGETANYQVGVGRAYTPPVTMSTTGLPAGSSSTFTANPVLATSTAITLSVATSQNTVVGSYPITITAADSNSPSPSIGRGGGGVRADITVELNVFDATPGAVTLAEPANQSTEVSRKPTFLWTPATQAATYIIEVDDHSDFNRIDYTATVTETRHTINRALSPNQRYYWRVRAANPCDSGLSTPLDTILTFSFTTKESFPILLVDDDDDYPDVREYYLDTLEALGQNVDVWDSSRRDYDPDASFLAPYEMVVWFTGDSFGEFAGPGEQGEVALAEYLDHGGCLLVSSQTYHFDKGLTPFMQDYLGVESVSEDRGHLVVSGDGAFSGLGPYTLTYPLPNYSDLVLPDETAEVAFSNQMDSAAVSKESDVYRTSFWSFPFEAIATKRERQEVMQRMVDWCEVEQQIAHLVGRVTDVDASDKEQLGAGIKNATVIVRDDRIERTATTDATGHYTITLTVDDDAQPIEMVAFAPNYQEQPISLDGLIAGGTIRQDFALQGSQLTYDTPLIEKAMEIGQIVSNTLTITNSGPLPIDYNFTIGGNYRYFIPLLLNSNGSESRSLKRTTEVVTTGEGEGGVHESDEFGYMVRDSKQANGPRYEFVNISPSGELVVLGDNNSAGPFPIDFDFDFYGTSQREFYLNSDGFISFEGAVSAPSNQCVLPKARTPNHLIALMWDDFQPNDVNAQVYYQNFSACPYGGGACLIVQYDKYHYYPASNYVRASFEAILFSNGDILMQYDHLGGRNGVTSTTGLENADGTMGLTYGTCDTPGHLTDKQALCFAHPDGNSCDSKVRDWASVTPSQGTIPPNSSRTLDVVFDATSHVQTDDSSAHLWLRGNFVNHLDPIPLTMSVSCPTCGALSGTMTDAENKKLVSSALEVTNEVTNEGQNEVTESDGFDVAIKGDRYRLVVAPGTYHLKSNANGYLSQSRTVTVTEGMTVTTDFDLMPDVAKLDVSLESLDKALQMGDLITHTLTITNSGVREVTVDLNLNDVEIEIERSRRDSASIRACPTAYHWTGRSNRLKILLYADDIIHRAPHTFPDQALRARELTYAAYYNDWEEFEACLISQKWDLVIFANDRGWPPSSILVALNEHLMGGGKLIYHSWTVTYSPSHPLWANMGFTWQGNHDAPDPIYWWQASHPMFTNPKSVPELTELDELDYLIYGQHVEPLPGALAVGGYQKTPQAEEAALIVGNQGRSVFKAFLDGPNSADLDADGVLDGLELWINLVTGIQNDFASPWIRVYPDHATLAPSESVTFEVLFDATSLEQVGQYKARLDVLGEFANEVDGIPVRMEVRDGK